VIGQAELPNAVEEVLQEYGKRQDQRPWTVFLKGTAEEQTQIRKRFTEKWKGFSMKARSRSERNQPNKNDNSHEKENLYEAQTNKHFAKR